MAIEAIEALRVSYKKMHPFGIPFATSNMGSAILAIDLVTSEKQVFLLRMMLGI